MSIPQKRTLTAVFIAALAIFSCDIFAQTIKGDYYQIKIYHYKTEKQEAVLDAYLQKSFVPALHKKGIKNIGVFKPIEADTADRKIYLLIPYASWKDAEPDNVSAGKPVVVTPENKDYASAVYNDAPYSRIETIWLSPFITRPHLMLPKLTGDRSKRVYELRSYESPTEAYHYSKVKMFNSGETDIFERLGFNPVFYGSVIAGGRMPNLMYLTTFNDKQSRDEHWKAFDADAQWKGLTGDAQYKNNVSKGDIIFLYPTAYSDY
ncbi:NIPSNAP family containing protein [Mucilaginibacter conchicola]|uniref:NIPSNAP family containing protein n=1 Tax=Mucilaginibacter conchicola TaxID=2303333 RepID=A0A372NX60_9SPHI|nr:NIPSNAP family protein [Mucilaginibacter conchicola]RFZ94703.1 NIPSNAP family containing protein [Mucilaginibacter conchicola]